MKMKFGDFVFPSNPETIKSSYSAKYSVSSIPDNNSIVENVCTAPAVITGNGEFFSANAPEHCVYLQRMLKDRKSRWLFAPGITPVKAYLINFEWEKNSKNKSCIYSFKFVEDMNKKQETEKLSYVTAEDGQNAFDIAYENKIKVDQIMRLNEFKTPFDIESGDKVVLR